MISIGVCAFAQPAANAPTTTAYANYIDEIIERDGLCVRRVEPVELVDVLADLKVLLTIGEGTLPESMTDWVAGGGRWISIAGVCGLPEVLGVEALPPAYALWGAGACTLGEGYLQPEPENHVLTEHIEIPLHFFNGIAARATTGKVIARCLSRHGKVTDRAGIVENRHGNGSALFIAVDVTGTIVRIQQGMPVTRDGAPSPDGTGPSSDNVLKSDDGQVLDWEFDRSVVPGAPGLMAFLHPVADMWREVIDRALLYCAREANAPLPLVWRWPRNLPAVAAMSHDSDLNEPENAALMLQTLKELGIRTTWCLMHPGLPAETVRAIESDGHELAFHYDAMSDGCPWSEEEFVRQYEGLRAEYGCSPVTNKNHYLRWEGDTEFYDWLIRRGFQMDQCKGASKTGEAGFNFGTTGPFFPVDKAGERLDVLEAPTITQDLCIFAPPEIAEPLRNAVLKSHGLLHHLFHPAHIAKPGVADALKACVNDARTAGMEWWTFARLNEWERARRMVRWTDCDSLVSETEIDDVAVLIPDDKGDTQRWGFTFRSSVISLKPGETAHLKQEQRQ